MEIGGKEPLQIGDCVLYKPRINSDLKTLRKESPDQSLESYDEEKFPEKWRFGKRRKETIESSKQLSSVGIIQEIRASKNGRADITIMIEKSVRSENEVGP